MHLGKAGNNKVKAKVYQKEEKERDSGAKEKEAWAKEDTKARGNPHTRLMSRINGQRIHLRHPAMNQTWYHFAALMKQKIHQRMPMLWHQLQLQPHQCHVRQMYLPDLLQ